MKLSIRVSDLQAALTCAAVKDIRSYLNGVYMEYIPNGDGGTLTFVGTDGHALFVGTAPAVFDDGEQSAPFWMTIPADTVKAACKSKMPCVTLADMPDGRYTLADTVFAPLDGKYPDFRRVVPDRVSGEIGNYDGDLLARAQKALNFYFQSKGKLFKLTQGGKNGCAVMAGNSRDACVVIMPFTCQIEAFGGMDIPAMPAPLRAVA